MIRENTPTPNDTANVTVNVKATSEPPTLQKLFEFIENQISILESIEEAGNSSTNKQLTDFNKNKNANVSTNSPF